MPDFLESLESGVSTNIDSATARQGLGAWLGASAGGKVG